jgi:signal transduction histidine kinase
MQTAQLAALDGLQQQVDRVTRSAQIQVLEQALRSAEISGRARRLSWSIAASALLLSLLILWLTIRSISRPLIRLTEGTQAVADGEFSVQLETRGRDELSRLASSFNQMVRRLGEAERAKKDFLSHVSHELKTPLASMYETNELLLEEIAGPLNDKQKRFLTLNLDSGRRLSAMIAKLLDLSRMEAGAMEYDFRHHDLVELVRTVVAGFEARARERQVRLLLRAPTTGVTVNCDYDRMIQVIQNLLDNALKFSPAASSIEIRVLPTGVPKAQPDWVDHTDSEIGQMSGDMVLLEVADSGPGIAEDQKPLVFRRFHQISRMGRAHATGGVGLGLAICGEITQAHQGWMGLRNNEEAGSVFMVALPSVEIPVAEDTSQEMWKEQIVGV